MLSDIIKEIVRKQNEVIIAANELKKQKKVGVAKIIAILTLFLTLIGGGGFLGWYYIWRDINPQHDYINWTYTVPWPSVNNSGEAIKDESGNIILDTTKTFTGRMAIQEGENSFTLLPYEYRGNCFVYKQDKTLSLQSTLSDNRNNIVGIGKRVTDGCSSLIYKGLPFRNNKYEQKIFEFECCWASED